MPPKDVTQRIEELQREIDSLRSLAGMSSDTQKTIEDIVARYIKDKMTLGDISDVTFTSPSDGQVVEYLDGLWINATDNT